MVRLAAVAVSVLSITGSSSTRIEESGMMQIREMKSEASQMEYLRNLQDTVKGMAKTKGKVPENAIDAVKQIQTSLNETLGYLKEEKTIDENEFQNNEIKAFETHANTYDDLIAHVVAETATSPKSKAASTVTTHNACRVAESNAHKKWTDCVGEENELRGTFDGKAAAVEGKQAAVKCASSLDDIKKFETSYVGDVNAYSTAISEMIKARTTLREKEQECAGYKSTLDSKTDECDTAQEEMEKASCNYASKVQTEVHEYGLLFTAASDAYDTGAGSMAEKSTNRFEQCKIIKLIQCYVESLEAYDADDLLLPALEACEAPDKQDERAEECESVKAVAEAKPARHNTMDIPPTHCGSGEYGTFPANTQKAETTQCPCPDNA